MYPVWRNGLPGSKQRSGSQSSGLDRLASLRAGVLILMGLPGLFGAGRMQLR